MSIHSTEGELRTSRFLIVDDHRLFLEGMRHLLKSNDASAALDLSVSVSDALLRIDRGTRYDLLLLDIELPDLDGFALMESLHQRNVVIPTIIVSSSTDAATIRAGIKLGASGFIHKNSSPQDMISTVNRVLAGELVLPREYQNTLELVSSEGDDPALAPQDDQLIGVRQLEVLKHIAKGLSNKQISNVMSISEATVKYHIAILFKSLGARNRTACLSRAREMGLLD